MNWINNYAQLKYFEEILGLIIGGIVFIVIFILWLVMWFKDFIENGKDNRNNFYHNCFICTNSRRKRLMLYFKFKDDKWFEAKSRSFAYMAYNLSYVSSRLLLMSFTKDETQAMIQIFSKNN